MSGASVRLVHAPTPLDEAPRLSQVLGVRVLGVDVARPPPPLVERIPALAAEATALAGLPAPAGELLLADHTGPHYAAVTDEGREAVRLAARTEGLMLDPVYTGKAMARD